ncbi:type III pantothenate kinase [Hominifimenecus sp. rT4P-3]|uniref:type III pantothenate kinase n=1 Tax=Hominifimenecus sp. rT4P-3 TaxID=3242979 RepID=UPI003DA25559
MILAVDIGNSNIVVGVVDQERIYFVERFSSDPRKTDLEYAIAIRTVLELHEISPKQLKGSILSSVVPPVSATVNRALQKIIGKPALLIGPGIKTGLAIRMDDPAKVGSDLIVDAVAGAMGYPLPQVIIDMGTATTLSIVGKGPAYLGTIIAPGAQVALDALIQTTSQLPRIPFESPGKVIGTNTVDCIKSGIILGNAAMLDGLIDRIEQELGEAVTVVATGGLAASITSHCRHNIHLDENLLLRGLYLIYQKNKG